MNRVVLVGYLAREVEIEQHRGGHLVGRTLLVVPRGRHGREFGRDAQTGRSSASA
jgi:single-stranded DNA-binding protein